MPASYLSILIFIIIAIPFAAAHLIVSHFFGPKKYDKRKLSVYECGVQPLTSARVKFSLKFFIIALIFIIFDVEVIFIYPWAIVYKGYLAKGIFILCEMLIFIAILLVGYIYVWKKGGLEWD